MAMLSTFEEMALEGFLDINESHARAYADPNFTIQTLIENSWWPGCQDVRSMKEFDTGCGEPCYTAQMMHEMWDFNGANPGRVVRYPSRAAPGIETVLLGGWWLPPPPSNRSGPAPIIVVQHGFQVNSNEYRQQVAAYELRRLGYGVILNNFRDHGYSDSSMKTSSTYQWGDATPYDMLGAWDYAVADPDGLLGGARGVEKVGLMGYSKGAFVTGSAFALEGRAIAAWMDGPPFRPSSVFRASASRVLADMGLTSISETLMRETWERLEEIALERGVDINKHIPEKTLQLGPDTRRPLSLVGNTGDLTVPITEVEAYLALLGGMPEKYSVTSWITSGACHETAHCVDHVVQRQEYVGRLCQFWVQAFGEGSCS